MNKRTPAIVTFILAIAAMIYGFVLVTQAGQGIGTPQNDGYAATGGILILASGLSAGYLLGERSKNKK